MRLLGNRLLLRPLAQKKESAGGILLPQQYQDNEKCYEVLAVGPGKRLKDGSVRAPEIRVGDRILTNLYHGQLHTFENGDIILDASQVEMIWR